MNERTAEIYQRYWDAFEAWCHRWGVRLPCPASAVTRWVVSLDTLAPPTQLIALAAIVSMFRHRHWRDIARDRHLVEFARGLRRYSTASTPPIPIPWVVMAIESCESTARGRRDAALLAISLVTGALPGQLRALNRADYEDHGGSATISIEGRRLAITAGKTGIALAAVHAHCRSTVPGPLFCVTDCHARATPERLTTRGIYNAIRRRLELVGTPANYCRTRAIRVALIDTVRPKIGNIAIMRRLGLRSAPWQARWR
jgi:integrase